MSLPGWVSASGSGGVSTTPPPGHPSFYHPVNRMNHRRLWKILPCPKLRLWAVIKDSYFDAFNSTCFRTGNHVAEPRPGRSSPITPTGGYESRMARPSTSATNSVNVARTVPTGSCRKAGKSRCEQLICLHAKCLIFKVSQSRSNFSAIELSTDDCIVSSARYIPNQ